MIGNSHLAAPKLAWEAFAQETGAAEPDFYGSARDTMLATTVENGRLVALSDTVARNFMASAGRDSIALEEYEGFIVISSTLGLRSLVAILHQHARCGEARETRYVASDAAISAAFDDMVFQSAGGHVARLLRRATDKPVWLVDRPQPGVGILTAKTAMADAFTTLNTPESRSALGGLLQRQRDKVEAEGIATLRQPADTLQDGWLTLERFSQDARKLHGATAYDAEDHFHMNATYGAALLRSIWPTVTGAQAAMATAS